MLGWFSHVRVLSLTAWYSFPTNMYSKFQFRAMMGMYINTQSTIYRIFNYLGEEVVPSTPLQHVHRRCCSRPQEWLICRVPFLSALWCQGRLIFRETSGLFSENGREIELPLSVQPSCLFFGDPPGLPLREEINWYTWKNSSYWQKKWNKSSFNYNIDNLKKYDNWYVCFKETATKTLVWKISQLTNNTDCKKPQEMTLTFDQLLLAFRTGWEFKVYLNQIAFY